MIKEYTLTWKEFKNHTSSDHGWVYRGQSSSDWPLESTLKRFSGSDVILARDYHTVLLHIQSDQRIKALLKRHQLSLPKLSPLLLGLLVGDRNHWKKMRQQFRFMHNFRHLGFPTPSIDWTKKRFIAAFFAASNIEASKPMAIFRLKIKSSSSPFGLKIAKINGIGNLHFREKAQKSVYTVALFQNDTDMLVDESKRTGSNYVLYSYEMLSEVIPGLKIEKYIIIDSGDRENRINILEELYKEEGISFKEIYGETDLLENTVIKDIAVEKILFNRNLFKQTEIPFPEHFLLIKDK